MPALLAAIDRAAMVTPRRRGETTGRTGA